MAGRSNIQNNPEHQWEVIAGIEKSQTKIAAVLDSIVTRLGTVEKKVVDAAKIPWGAVGVSLAALTFVLGGFITLISYTYSSNLSHVASAVGTLTETVRVHQSNGHPDNVIGLVRGIGTELDAVRKRLDTVVPREEHAARDKYVNQRFIQDDGRFSMFRENILERVNRLENHYIEKHGG